MPTQRHYPRAPITEAIIDLKVELPDGARVAELEKVHAGLETAYPNRRNRLLGEFQGHVGRQGAAATARSMHVGFLFTSRGEKQIFQAQLDGFTMSRLAPYESREAFRDGAGAFGTCTAPL